MGDGSLEGELEDGGNGRRDEYDYATCKRGASTGETKEASY